MTKLSTAIAATVVAVSAFMAVGPASAQLSPITWPYDTPLDIPGGSPSSSYSCSDELGYLRRVHAAELEAIDDSSRVFVTPICVNDRMMRSDGNAGALRHAIATNGAMQEALLRKDSRHEDVVGIRMTGDDTVILYVHPFRD